MGNVQQMRHVAAGGNFNRDFNYGIVTNNHLGSIDTGGNNYSFSYDVNGNMIQENSNRFFEWDHSDQLRAFYNQAGASEPSIYEHYLYDASGNRIKKITRKDTGTHPFEVTIYIDGIYERSYKWDGTSGYTEEKNELHIMDDKSRIAMRWIGHDDGTPEVKYILDNHLGSSNTILENDAGASVYNREEYFPFGESSFGSFGKKRYRYVGKEKDEYSGLYYYGARYYSAWTCRFISTDPLYKEYPFYTPYNYAGNKPVTKYDIDGLQENGSPSQGGSGPVRQPSVPEVGAVNEPDKGIQFASGDTDARKAYENYVSEVDKKLSFAKNNISNINAQLSASPNKKTKRWLEKQLEKAQADLSTYTQIKTELDALENAEEAFRLRSGSNITDNSGGGNIRFNPQTLEIDVNLDFTNSTYNDMQRIAHELKHAYQYLTNRLLLAAEGNGGANSKELEEEAFNRQNLFANNESERVNNVAEFVATTKPYSKFSYKNISALPSSGNYKNIMGRAYGSGKAIRTMGGYITYGWKAEYEKGLAGK